MSHIFFVLVCLIWGTSFILIERARHAFGVVDVSLGRLAGGALVMGVVWLVSRRSARLRPGDWWRIAFAAFVGSVLPYSILAYCIAPGRFGHSYFGMLMALVPLATIVVSVPMLRLWPTARQLVGVVGGLLCTLVLAKIGDERGMSLGFVLLALGVPLCYAVGNTFIKWQLSHVPAAALTTLLLGTAAGILLPLELVPSLLTQLELARPTAPRDWSTAISALAFLGAVCTGLAIWMFNRMIVERGPLFASMVTYVFPLVALGIGHLDGERITIRQLVAMAGVLAMVAIVQLGRPAPASKGPATAAAGDEASPNVMETGGI